MEVEPDIILTDGYLEEDEEEDEQEAAPDLQTDRYGIHFFKPVSECCGSGIRCPSFEPWIRGPGWVKNHDSYPVSGSGMNNPDHISAIFRVKYLNSWMRIRDGKNSDPG